MPGTQPITLFLNEDFIRAPPGGVGNVKAASNYGAAEAGKEHFLGGNDPDLVLSHPGCRAYDLPTAASLPRIRHSSG